MSRLCAAGLAALGLALAAGAAHAVDTQYTVQDGYGSTVVSGSGLGTHRVSGPLGAAIVIDYGVSSSPYAVVSAAHGDANTNAQIDYTFDIDTNSPTAWGAIAGAVNGGADFITQTPIAKATGWFYLVGDTGSYAFVGAGPGTVGNFNFGATASCDSGQYGQCGLTPFDFDIYTQDTSLYCAGPSYCLVDPLFAKTISSSLTLSVEADVFGGHVLAYVDPTITLNPDFFSAANGLDINDFTLTTPGVGNTLPAAPPGGVPEPSSWVLMLFGVGGIGSALRMTRRKENSALTAA